MAEELELIPPQPFNNDSPRSSTTNNNNNNDERKFNRLPSLLESRNTDSPIPSSFDGEGNGRGLAGIGGRLTDSPTAGMRTDSPFSLNDDQGSSNGNDEQDLEDLSMEEVDTNSAAASDEDAHVQLKDDSSSKALSKFAVNWLFVKRSMRILYIGLQNPLKFPILWLIVAINIASQVLGAWMIQDFLYVLATGKTSDQAKKTTPRMENGKWINTTYVANYPGISGCLKSGCGTYDGNTVVKAPGDPVKVGGYLADFAWMFCVSMFLVVLMSWTGDIICTIMRRNIALNIQKRLMGNTTNKLLYRLTVDGTMDNIDQRITSDLQVVLDGFCCVIFGNTADYLAYPFVFSVTRMSLSFNNTMGPLDDPTKESRVVFLVLGAVTITFLAYFIPMNHVSRIFYRGQKYEGDFRTTHTKTVLSCEQISTLGGEPAERVYAQQQFLRVDANNRVYYIWQGALMFLRLLVSIIIPAMSYISMAIAETRDSTFANFFQKQIGDVFEYFLYIPAMAERLAYACGASHRVGTLLEQMDEFEEQPIYSNCRNANNKIELKNVFANPPVPMKLDRDDTLFGSCINKCKSCLGSCGGCCCNTGAHVGVCCVCCGNVTITYQEGGESKAIAAAQQVALKTEQKVAFTGTRKNLFENVSLRINAGQSVVIMGPSGCGKSSLLRVIGGLWGIDSGSIERPTKVGSGGVFFLPQRPYTFPGSLRAQVLYPQPDSDDINVAQKVEEALRIVHLSHLIKKYGLDQSVGWDSVLSISEMQRLNFARMFYHRPLFCLADEATSALDLRLESLCYQKASDFGITMVSVAHRPTVVPHHQFVFEYVTENNSWTLRSADEVKICEKFPIDGFVEDSVIQSEDVPIEEEKPEGFNLKFLSRLWRAFRLAVRSPKSQGTLFLFIMAVCVGIYGMMQIIIFKDYGTSKIIAFVVAGDVNSAMRGAGTIIGLNSVSTFMQSISACLGAFLAMKIHRAIITKFHKDYYTPAVPYYMNRIMKQPGIDQRMVQDLAGMREALAWLFGNPFAFFNYRLGLFPLLIVWIILLGYALSMAWGLTTFFLFWIVFSYLSQVFSSHFTSLAIEKRQAAEGDLRLHLGRVLANIESITFFGGQQQELATADELLMNVFYKKMAYVYRCLATSIPTITMYYWLQTGVYVMAAILQIWWTFGAMSNTELFTIINFNIIFAKVTQLVIMSMGGFGAVAGYTHRVMDIIEKAEQAKEMVDETYSKIKQTNDIRFNELSLQAPTVDKSNARTLVSHLSASVQSGESLCISGPSSSGKSSILRALHGLWTPSSGSVSRPHFGSGGIFFLPQASYASQGTLAAQVVYPLLLKETKATNREIASILAEVGLGEIVRKWGLHKVVHWDYVLSGGEMQRLGFAKLLFHRPKFAVMDEGTSALDLKLEAKCMRAIQKRGITLLSIVTRTSVIPYHQKQLLLASDGSYKIVPVGSNPPTNDDPKKGTMADIPESDDVLRPSALSVGGPSHVTLHFGEH